MATMPGHDHAVRQHQLATINQTGTNDGITVTTKVSATASGATITQTEPYGSVATIKQTGVSLRSKPRSTSPDQGQGATGGGWGFQ